MANGGKTALLLGATGLVGGHVLQQLLDHPSYIRVVAIGRRPLPLNHAKLEQRTVDFENLDQRAEAFRGDEVFCCLGTTLARAGSKEAFRRVDHDYPVAIARLASAAGTPKWLMISSVGASATSRNFYLRVKGEVERDVAKLPFRAAHFFRPSFLLGKRAERRPLEELGIPVFKALARAMVGPLRRFRPIEASEVARRMIAAAQTEAPGLHVHDPMG